MRLNVPIMVDFRKVGESAMSRDPMTGISHRTNRIPIAELCASSKTMISDLKTYITDNLNSGLIRGASSLERLAQENRVITWTACAGVAGYFLLKGPVMNFMRKEFAHTYANVYLPNMDKMLHEFRSTISAHLDEYREKNPNNNERQLLEVGIGPGSSLEYYKDKSVKVIGLEPNEYFCGILANKRAEYPFLSVVTGRCEDLSDFRDETVDIVVSSLVLCSVSDLRKSIDEIQRVLKKGGRFYFYEHQACPDSWGLYFYQLLYTPVFMLTMDGCRPSRSVYKAINENGCFDMTFTCQEDGPKPSIFKPITHGYAIKK